MPIKLGNSDIAKYYIGNTQASKIYLGSNLVTTPAITFPTPSFGTDNLRMWLDTNKTWSDILGGSQPSMYTDTVGYNSVSALVDLSGNGFSFTQGDKSIQPLVGCKCSQFDFYIYSPPPINQILFVNFLCVGLS